MDKPQILIHADKSLDYTCYDCKWIPKSARFVVLGCQPKGSGVIEVMSLNEGRVENKHKFEKKYTIKCGTFGAALEDRLLATGDFGGQMSMWDLEKCDLPLYTVIAHKNKLINCIDGCGGSWGKGAPEIATGGSDGCVHVWDPRQDSEPVISLVPPEGIDKIPDCWSVGFGNSYDNLERCLCCGYDNGDIKLLDMRTRSLRWEANVRNGICSVEFDRKDIDMNKLVATTLESKYYLFDMRTFHPQHGYANLAKKVGQGTLWKVAHFPSNRDLFATLGGSGTLSIFKYAYPTQRSRTNPEDGKSEGVMGKIEVIVEQTLSTQPLHSLDWHPDKGGLGVCTSFDQHVRVVLVTKLNK